MADKHVFEGAVGSLSSSIMTTDGSVMDMQDILETMSEKGDIVRITVEVLKTSGGATKEAVQRES